MNLWTIIRNLFFKRVGLVRLYVAETGTPPCEVDERVTWGMKGKSVYAHAGEWITCERGHKICQVTHDIRVGDMQSPDIDFGEWQQEEPKVGAFPIPRCALCGARFTSGTVYHFEDGWRTSKQSDAA